MFLKVVKYAGDVHQGFDLYEGRRIQVAADHVTVEGDDGAINILLGSREDAHPLKFFILNDKGDTVESFSGGRFMPKEGSQAA